MFTWIKKLREIVRSYDANHQQLDLRMQQLEADQGRLVRSMHQLEVLVRERTDIAVDVRSQGGSYAVVVGRYRNADYIQMFQLHDRDLGELIAQLQNMQRYAHLRQVDAPPDMSATVKRGAPNWR